MSRFNELADSGEIVSTKSLLALDEDLICRRCSAIFTLAEANWEGKHPEFESVTAIGFQCPKCRITNVAYYKTAKLYDLERAIDKAVTQDQFDKGVKKYRREFIQVQKKYGGVSESP